MLKNVIEGVLLLPSFKNQRIGAVIDNTRKLITFYPDSGDSKKRYTFKGYRIVSEIRPDLKRVGWI